jgi:hypothetical protein
LSPTTRKSKEDDALSRKISSLEARMQENERTLREVNKK